MNDLELTIEVASSYRVGYPMAIAATVVNPLPQRTYFALPEIDRFEVPPPLELVLVRVGEQDGQRLPTKATAAHEGEPEGFRLGPGESRRMLFDLAELAPVLAAGAYELRARYVARPVSAVAAPVRFDVLVPGEAEASAIARLRASNTLGEPSWNAFVLDNFREIEAHELRDIPAAERPRLAMVLALHVAIYGPLGPDRLPPQVFAGSGDAPLAAELAAIEHELAAARSDPSTIPLQQQLLAQWPGMAWRIQGNLDRDGMIARLRRVAGADREWPAPPSPLPYGGASP